jgi:hypothetical protein
MFEVNKLFQSHNPITLDVEKQYPVFFTCFTDEDHSFKIIPKSPLTKQLEDADMYRDSIYSSFKSQVRISLKHYDVSIKESAHRLFVYIDGYGSVTRHGRDQETAELYNIIEDLNDKYRSDIDNLHLTDWVREIESANQTYEALNENRSQESTEASALTRLRQARKHTDESYRVIVERINAGIIFNGLAKYEAFVYAINERINHYNTLIAQRKGRNKKSIEE